jgi:hypothetical protein
MSHKRSKLERQVQRALAVPPPRQSLLGKLLGNTWTVIVGAATLVGLFAIWPRVSMTPADPADPQDPFSERFTITNSGIVRLYDVSVAICVGQIIAEPSPFVPAKTFRLPCSTIQSEEWTHHTLRTDEPFTVSTQGIFVAGPGAKLSGADIAVRVTYQAFFLPFHQQAVFRFVTHRLSNGSVYWSSTPLE